MNNQHGYMDENEPEDEQYAHMLHEIKQKQDLLEMAAVNGALLAQKYFQLENNMEQLQHKHDQVVAVLESMEESLDQLRTEKHYAVKRSMELEQKMYELVQTKQHLDRRTTMLETTCQTLEKNMHQATTQQRQSSEALRMAKEEIVALTHVRTRLKSTLDALQTERKELQQYVVEKNAQIAELVEREKKLTLSNQVQHRKLVRLENYVQELEMHSQGLQEELEAAYNTINALEGKARVLAQQIAQMKAAQPTPAPATAPCNLLTPPPTPSNTPSTMGMLLLLVWLSLRRAMLRRDSWIGMLSAKPQWWLPVVHNAWRAL